MIDPHPDDILGQRIVNTAAQESVPTATARMIWGTVRAEGCEIILIERPGNADVLARELAYRWPRGATFN